MALPVNSIESQIDQDVQTILAAAGLSGIDAANIKIRELPTKLQKIDTVPLIVIAPAPSDNASQKASGFEGSLDRRYRREIALIDASDGDYLTDKDARETWFETAMSAIARNDDGTWRTTLPDVPSVWNIEVTRASTFDRDKFPDGYAYLSFIVEFWSNE